MNRIKFLNILFLFVLLSTLLGGQTLAVKAIPAIPKNVGTLRSFNTSEIANSSDPGNVVSEWNAIVQDILQPLDMMMGMGGISMATSFVYLGYTQAAVYDALLAIEGGLPTLCLYACRDQPHGLA